MNRVVNVLKKYGIIGCILKLLNKISFRVFRFFNVLDDKFSKKRVAKYKEKQQALYMEKYKFLENKIKDKKYKYVFVFFPYVEWNLPIFQRPHQIALELSKRDDVLYLFASANCQFDKITDVYEEINENLYVISDFDFICNIETDKRIIHLYSADTVSKYDVVEQAFKRGDKVLYEYIDEIHEEITHSLPDYYLEKHNRILKDERCYVVATADKLYDDVKKVRKSKYTLSTNGVNVEDFNKSDSDEVPEDLVEIKDKYERILCYYGALATWFDYDLLKKLAKKYPKYAIVLIGMEYDNAFKDSKITNLENVYYLGKRNYFDLHKYSANSDLLMIPFKINEITESTSPVKLFEYMAANVPILTTDMKECRKYQSVIIGKDHDDFISKIDSTIDKINDANYIEMENNEALENTWEKKSEAIINLLDKGEDSVKK